MSHKSITLAVALALSVHGTAFAQDDATDSAQPDPAISALEGRVDAAKADKSEAQTILDGAQAELDAAQVALRDAVPLTLTQGWSFDAQAGVNGSTGNTEKYNYRFNVNGDRETKRLATSLNLNYQYENSEGDTTDNRFVAAAKNDWKLEDSKWRVFANAMYEYDEFQDWDQRYSGFAGMGYEITDNEKHTLLGRAGLGGNQTIGGDDESFTPEGFLGLDYTWRIKQGQRFKAGTVYFPSLDKPTDYRLNNYAEYQLVLSEKSNMIFSVGAEHRMDSDPGDAKRNDLDYYMTLGWRF